MKPVILVLVNLFIAPVALAQAPEPKGYVILSGLSAGPGDEIDPFEDTSLQPDERCRLGSLGSERLDVLLREALHLGRLRAIVELLDAGADPNGLGPQRGSPLVIAAGARTDGPVRMLLRYGADPNAVPLHGKTALMRAAHSGRSATVRALLEAGASVDSWDREGKTALDYAIAGKHNECAAILRGSP